MKKNIDPQSDDLSEILKSNSIGLFVNSLAGKGSSKTIALQVRDYLSQKGIPTDWFIDDWPDVLTFKEIWIFGGDGTVNYFINKYPNTKCPLAVFKGGTGNDFAWKLNGELSLYPFIDALLEAPTFPIDVASCNGRLFINGVGIGFDGEVLRSMQSIRWLGGHLGYLWAVITRIFTYSEQHFKCSFNGVIRQGKYLLVNIANSSRTGGGFMISPLAEVEDGLLNLLLVKPVSKLKRIFFLPNIQKGTHLHLDIAEHNLITQVLIQCDQTISAQIDGELFSASSFDISIYPRHFNFKFIARPS